MQARPACHHTAYCIGGSAGLVLSSSGGSSITALHNLRWGAPTPHEMLWLFHLALFYFYSALYHTAVTLPPYVTHWQDTCCWILNIVMSCDGVLTWHCLVYSTVVVSCTSRLYNTSAVSTTLIMAVCKIAILAQTM
jgi:hypothetical protein